MDFLKADLRNEKPVWRRRAAAKAIQEIGVEAAPLLPVLLERLGDDDNDTGVAVAEALASLGPAARPGLIKRFSNSLPIVRAARSTRSVASSRLLPMDRGHRGAAPRSR